MVKRLAAFAIDQPLFLGLLTALFIAVGLAAFRSLPVEAFPDVSDVQTTVITLDPGHAAEEVEKQITIPLEIALGPRLADMGQIRADRATRGTEPMAR